jgi:hypothetical protein
MTRAYRREAADYAAALLRHDSYSNRVFDVHTHDAAAAIGLYLYPGQPASSTAPVVASAVYFMDADVRLDLAEPIANSPGTRRKA